MASEASMFSNALSEGYFMSFLRDAGLLGDYVHLSAHDLHHLFLRHSTVLVDVAQHTRMLTLYRLYAGNSTGLGMAAQHRLSAMRQAARDATQAAKDAAESAAMNHKAVTAATAVAPAGSGSNDDGGSEASREAPDSATAEPAGQASSDAKPGSAPGTSSTARRIAKVAAIVAAPGRMLRKAVRHAPMKDVLLPHPLDKDTAIKPLMASTSSPRTPQASPASSGLASALEKRFGVKTKTSKHGASRGAHAGDGAGANAGSEAEDTDSEDGGDESLLLDLDEDKAQAARAIPPPPITIPALQNLLKRLWPQLQAAEIDSIVHADLPKVYLDASTDGAAVPTQTAQQHNRSVPKPAGTPASTSSKRPRRERGGKGGTSSGAAPANASDNGAGKQPRQQGVPAVTFRAFWVWWDRKRRVMGGHRHRKNNGSSSVEDLAGRRGSSVDLFMFDGMRTLDVVARCKEVKRMRAVLKPSRTVATDGEGGKGDDHGERASAASPRKPQAAPVSDEGIGDINDDGLPVHVAPYVGLTIQGFAAALEEIALLRVPPSAQCTCAACVRNRPRRGKRSDQLDPTRFRRGGVPWDTALAHPAYAATHTAHVRRQLLHAYVAPVAHRGALHTRVGASSVCGGVMLSREVRTLLGEIEPPMARLFVHYATRAWTRSNDDHRALHGRRRLPIAHQAAPADERRGSGSNTIASDSESTAHQWWLQPWWQDGVQFVQRNPDELRECPTAAEGLPQPSIRFVDFLRLMAEIGLYPHLVSNRPGDVLGLAALFLAAHSGDLLGPIDSTAQYERPVQVVVKGRGDSRGSRYRRPRLRLDVAHTCQFPDLPPLSSRSRA